MDVLELTEDQVERIKKAVAEIAPVFGSFGAVLYSPSKGIWCFGVTNFDLFAIAGWAEVIARVGIIDAQSKKREVPPVPSEAEKE